MITSFETEKELVFVCEYAVSDLHKLLAKVGSLGEPRTQKISFDLVSALYYLHSHRILHRDLKPPNILLDKNYRGKLCDFGLSRNMTLGTQILTSIKGTPLYMAPELLEGRGYSHEADLWSLGCIIYEMLAGESPFNTRSILHLMKLIKYSAIKWPSFLSPTCISFLKGLLVNNPLKRSSWDEILEHPFVKGNILILDKDQVSSSPFTKPIKGSRRQSEEEVETVEQMRAKMATFSLKPSELENEIVNRLPDQPEMLFQPGVFHNIQKFQLEQPIRTHKVFNFQPVAENSNMVMHRLMDECDFHNFFPPATKNNEFVTSPEEIKECKSVEMNNSSLTSLKRAAKSDGISTETSSIPVETEEWLQFLFKAMQEILDGDLEIYKQNNMMTLIVGLLRNSKFNFKLIDYVVQIICLPYAIDVPQLLLAEIDKLYLQMKLVPNLIYASKLLCGRKLDHNSMEVLSIPRIDKIIEFTDNELKTLCSIYDAVVYLVHTNESFLGMLCDAISILNVDNLFRSFILSGINHEDSKEAVRLSGSIIALICAILQEIPENANLIEHFVFHDDVQLSKLLQHKDTKIKIRSCQMIRLLGRFRCLSLQSAWSNEMNESLAKLLKDDNDEVKKESAILMEEFKDCIGWFSFTKFE